jgi:hypothetical protein
MKTSMAETNSDAFAMVVDWRKSEVRLPFVVKALYCLK